MEYLNTEYLKKPGIEITLSNEQIFDILNKAKKLNGSIDDREVFSVLSDIVNNTYDNIKKTHKYDPDDMRNLSARQLLIKKEVFFMNSCLEYTLLMLHYMKKTGFSNTKFVINELSTQYNGLYKLHFGLEGEHANQNYYIDNRRRNSVYIGKGKFDSKYEDVGENIVNTIYIPGDLIGFDDNFPKLYKNLDIKFRFFNPELIQVFKKKFQNDNTPDQWKKGFLDLVGHPEKPEITIE